MPNLHSFSRPPPGMGWALGVLRWAVDFPSFTVLGAVGIAIMVSLGYAWDWLVARNSQQLPPAVPPDRQ
jgi:hypothetical protein